jgi:acyl-CoA synthetase (AMP-forming)/AMP-acid ligase II
MTETFGPYCGYRLDHDMPSGGHGSCGQAFAGIEVRIVEDEIRVRGPNVMRGICGRTRDATFDADGFYPTGDLGALDAAGFLRYQGRVDDMFKVRGATVYPAEVEAALRAVDGVRQAHVTNVRNDDGTDAVGALVVSAIPINDLVAGTRERLSSFKVPTRWIVTDAGDRVPRTATDKVDKAALQELLAREGTVG